ncbi:MAG: hypothetical protein V3T31_00995 [candidate division Zixibacteria bacterium]
MSTPPVIRAAVLFTVLLVSVLAVADKANAVDSEKCQDNGIENPTVAQDFLAVNTYCKNIRYVSVVKIWTDIDQEHIKDALARAVRKSVTAALSSGENEGTAAGGFMEKLQAEMTSAAFDELIKTPKVYKLLNKRIQIDVYFIPQIDSPDDFDNELASNMLVRMNDMNSLSRRMIAEDNPVDWSQLQKSFDQIISLSERKKYIYLGGVATASLKLVDLDWHPTVIPDTDNIVKGFLRFRRWFAAESIESTRLREGQETTVHEIRFGEAGSRSFVTSDVSYNFNLKNAMPSLHSMEVRFGSLLDGHGRDMRTLKTFELRTPVPFIGELLPTSGIENVLTQQPLLIEGETSGFLSGSFDREIHSLVWSFETQSVDADRTQADWTLFSATYFDELMDEHGRYIVDELGLGRFYDLDARSKTLVNRQRSEPRLASAAEEHVRDDGAGR